MNYQPAHICARCDICERGVPMKAAERRNGRLVCRECARWLDEAAPTAGEEGAR